MPHQPTATEMRLNYIIASLKPAAGLLGDLHDALGPPFIPAITNTTLSLIIAAEARITVKRNKDECILLLENVHGLISAIVSLFMKSGTPGILPPTTLDHVGKFAETLHKIHVFIQGQQEGNKLKQLFRQSEMNNLFRGCRKELQQAVEVFEARAENGLTISNNLQEIKEKTEAMQMELLELISTLSETSLSSSGSSMYRQLNGSWNSSNSFSLLPAKPKIFHGRQYELDSIIATFTQGGSPRIAILGGGGMGKTTLAKSVLHHPDISSKFGHRLIVSAESCMTTIDLANQVGLVVGLKPGKNLTKAVVQHFEINSPCLLVLDNLDTVWEPLESRDGVEEFLALLADVKDLALIITMRGVERPAKIRWSRPFLGPLNPLSDAAGKQIFMDIAEDYHDTADIDQVLKLTDYMPLAVELMAHLVDSEGCDLTVKSSNGIVAQREGSSTHFVNPTGWPLRYRARAMQTAHPAYSIL
ncbi:P-loop containing nucleoside triphosphate hydrolase protein [Mycena crocata]|nr:P-loop containing nucleoside triphosphate hydrolase protein [Mycena crocata]